MNPAAIAWLILVLAIAAVAGIFLLVLRIFAQMVVGLKHSITPAKIVDWRSSPDTVTLRADKYTRTPGEYALSWNDGQGTARVGRIISEDPRLKSVDRELLELTGQAPNIPTTKAQWNGFVFSGPDDVGVPWSDVTIPIENGAAPAWHFHGNTDTWVIHVHGIRVSRLSPLRAIPVFAELGYNSLVISYRGDGEAPSTQGGASTLGLNEWPDVEPAIDYALAHGAKRVLLSGWSMGGGMALLTAERAHNRDAIDGLILVGPASNWSEVVLYGARQAKVPEGLGRLVVAGLSRAPWSRLLGGGKPIDFTELDWTTRRRPINVPTLIIHSSADDEIPVELSRRLAAENTSVRLVEIEGALHTLEWNKDREAFNNAIREWSRTAIGTR